jgi:hypothetical protein
MEVRAGLSLERMSKTEDLREESAEENLWAN